MEDLEARVTELEIRFSFQEDLLRTLNDIVRKQQDEIEILKKLLTNKEPLTTDD